MSSNVVVGVKELEDGATRCAWPGRSPQANGNLTLAHVQVVAPSPRPTRARRGLRRDTEMHWSASQRCIAQRLADAPPCPLLVVRLVPQTSM
jgi:hypothetical protein